MFRVDKSVHRLQPTNKIFAKEDLIYICEKCKTAINKEIKAKTPTCPKCGSDKFTEKMLKDGNVKIVTLPNFS